MRSRTTSSAVSGTTSHAIRGRCAPKASRSPSRDPFGERFDPLPSSGPRRCSGPGRSGPPPGGGRRNHGRVLPPLSAGAGPEPGRSAEHRDIDPCVRGGRLSEGSGRAVAAGAWTSTGRFGRGSVPGGAGAGRSRPLDERGGRRLHRLKGGESRVHVLRAVEVFERFLAAEPAEVPDRPREILLREARIQVEGSFRRSRRERVHRNGRRRHGVRGNRSGRPGGRRAAREERLDLAEELVRVERLRNDRVALETFGPLPVEGLERAGEKQDRNAGGRRVLLVSSQTLPVFLGHHESARMRSGDLCAPTPGRAFHWRRRSGGSRCRRT